MCRNKPTIEGRKVDILDWPFPLGRAQEQEVQEQEVHGQEVQGQEVHGQEVQGQEVHGQDQEQA